MSRANPLTRKQHRDRRVRKASAVRRDLIKLLGGKCDKCGKRYIPILQIDHVDGCTWNQRQLNRADRQFKFMREYKAGVRLRILCSSCNKIHLPERSINTHGTERPDDDCPF